MADVFTQPIADYVGKHSSDIRLNNEVDYNLLAPTSYLLSEITLVDKVINNYMADSAGFTPNLSLVQTALVDSDLNLESRPSLSLGAPLMSFVVDSAQNSYIAGLTIAGWANNVNTGTYANSTPAGGGGEGGGDDPAPGATQVWIG